MVSVDAAADQPHCNWPGSPCFGEKLHDRFGRQKATADRAIVSLLTKMRMRRQISMRSPSEIINSRPFPNLAGLAVTMIPVASGGSPSDEAIGLNTLETVNIRDGRSAAYGNQRYQPRSDAHGRGTNVWDDERRRDTPDKPPTGPPSSHPRWSVTAFYAQSTSTGAGTDRVRRQTAGCGRTRYAGTATVNHSEEECPLRSHQKALINRALRNMARSHVGRLHLRRRNPRASNRLPQMQQRREPSC